jgi:hypothetical protein
VVSNSSVASSNNAVVALSMRSRVTILQQEGQKLLQQTFGPRRFVRRDTDVGAVLAQPGRTLAVSAAWRRRSLGTRPLELMRVGGGSVWVGTPRVAVRPRHHRQSIGACGDTSMQRMYVWRWVRSAGSEPGPSSPGRCCSRAARRSPSLHNEDRRCAAVRGWFVGELGTRLYQQIGCMTPAAPKPC